MGRGKVVAGMRGTGVLASRSRDDDDGSDCSNRDGFLETLRVGDLLVNFEPEDVEEEDFYYSMKRLARTPRSLLFILRNLCKV